ncbi:hypothetical protein QZH41_016054 [Actinostola sp. cb2023]|nr:hypothetical protein QZH41_016054 [Actinostola sp. cb2023]
MAISIVGTLPHFAFAIYFMVVMYHDLKIQTPGVLEFGWRWKYLTFLNLVSQLTFFVLASLIDVVTLLRGQETKWIVSVRDVLFASIVFPIGVFVAVTFWGIYAIDRELIFPTFLDSVIPNWINHALHTWCAVAVILESAINCHVYPRNRVGILFLLGFGAIYISWISYIAYAQDYWVYPFLRVMENSVRVAFFAVCAILLTFFYFLGKWMTNAIWGGKVSAEMAQEKKQANKKKVKKVE